MNCRACGGQTETVFEMEPMPLAGSFTETRQGALDAPKYPLSWEWCNVCGLVNVAPDIPGEMIYADYSYRASDVPALVRHHRDFAAWLDERFGRPGLRFLEIGGNDGVLLRQLPGEWDKWNVDPSDVANVEGDWFVFNESWPIRQPHERAGWDLITSSNAFAHFSEIGAGLDAVREALAPGGHFVMEVHDLDATLRTAQWDTIYHEHAVEWSLNALIAAGSLHGLSLIESERLPLHGGSIRSIFTAKAPYRHTPDSRPRQAEGFAALRRAYRKRQAPKLPKGAIAYGAAARATVYLNQVRPDVDYVIDGSPRRQWRFVPGVGLPIYPPEVFGDPTACLITAWNHAEDIKAQHLGYDRWVTAW